MKKKKILIIGGTGFIGYHLASKCKKLNWDVTSVSTKKPTKETYTKSLVSSVPPTNKKISRFVIIEKENKNKKENNLKILKRWSKKEIIKQNLVQVKNLNKSFDDNFFTESL